VSGRCTQAREIWRRGNMTPLGPSAPLLCYWAQRELRLQNLGAARDLLAQAQAADPHHAHSAALAASLEDRARTSGARMQSSGPQRTARQQPVAHAGEKQQDSGIVQGSPGDTLPPSVADLSSTQASQQGGGSGRQLPDGGHTAIAMAGGAATALEGQEGSSSQGGAVSQPGTVSNAGGGSRHESPAALHARAQSLLARGRREEAEQVGLSQHVYQSYCCMPPSQLAGAMTACLCLMGMAIAHPTQCQFQPVVLLLLTFSLHPPALRSWPCLSSRPPAAATCATHEGSWPSSRGTCLPPRPGS
jgi:hypothetical protein